MGDVEEPPRRSTLSGSQLFQTKQRAEDVQAWAQRMRDKRAAREAEMQPKEEPNHWSADALFADSRQVAEDELMAAESTSARSTLLASFGLGPLATPHEVNQAYKELAKLHHPDRYAMASPEVQAHHSDAMSRINNAYRALRDSR